MRVPAKTAILPIISGSEWTMLLSTSKFMHDITHFKLKQNTRARIWVHMLVVYKLED